MDDFLGTILGAKFREHVPDIQADDTPLLTNQVNQSIRQVFKVSVETSAASGSFEHIRNWSNNFISVIMSIIDATSEYIFMFMYHAYF